MSHASIIPGDSALYQSLRREALARRCLVFAGLPGTGKSLLTQQTALIARAAGRAVLLLQWDVARAAFESPAILARYPEIDGVTHPVIRKAAGLWARQAAARWMQQAGATSALLIIEAPLIGGRLIELAQPAQDDAETLLASDAALFILPVPSIEVKAALRARRGSDMQTHSGGAEQFNAPVHLLDAHVRDISEAAALLGMTQSVSAGYDAALYARVYLHALRHRRSLRLDIGQLFEVSGSVYGHAEGVKDLLPEPDDVAAAYQDAERIEPAALSQQMAGWFR